MALKLIGFKLTVYVKQGCLLSPLLFSLFINDLAISLKNLGLGVNVDEERVSVLLYEDDIVILAENEKDLQILLNCLGKWCLENKMNVSVE